MRVFKDIRLYILLALLTAVAFLGNGARAQGPITADFFGEHFLGPFQQTFKWPTTNPSFVRPYLMFWCNPRVCTGGIIGGTAGTRILWRDLEYADNTFDFAGVGKMLDSLKNHNSKMIYILGRTPQFHSTQPGLSNYYAYPPSDTAKLGRFVRALATYAINRGTPIEYWETWNEPETNSSEWRGTWAELVKIGRCLYTNVKAINPAYQVISPSTQGSGADYWIGQYFAQGGAAFCDIVAFHGYINFYNGGSQEKFETLITKMKSMMTTYNISSKPLWDDEGFDAFSAGVGSISPYSVAKADTQSAYMAQRYLISAAKGVAKVFHYAWDANNGKEWEDTDGNGSYEENLVGKANRIVQGWMIGATVSNLTVTADSIYSATLTLGATVRKVVWSRSKLAKTYSVGTYTQAEDLAGTTTSVSGNISLGIKPILLKTSITPHKSYNVANVGNDTWPGTQAAPFLTIAKALAVMVPGDTMKLRGGDAFYSNNYISPTQHNGIVITTYGAGKASWIGSKTYSSFTSLGGSKYAFTDPGFPAWVNIVVKDNRLSYLASKTDSFETFTTVGTNYIAGTGLTGNHAGERVVLKLRNWADGVANVLSQSVDTIRYGTAGLNKAVPYAPLPNYGFRLFNSLNYLTSDYRHVYDSLNKRVTFYSTFTPTPVTVAILPNAANVDASYVTIENMIFSGFNRWAIIGGGSNNEIRNCEFAFVNDACIYVVDRRNWNVHDNIFRDGNNDAIKALNGGVGANAWNINNNSFKRFGLSHLHGYNGDPQYIAVYVAGDSLTMRYNTGDSTGYNMFHWDGDGATVEYNYGKNSNLLAGDGGTFYTYHGSTKATTTPAKSYVRYNTAINAPGSSDGVYPGTYDLSNKNGKGANYYFDEHANNIDFSFNTGADASWTSVMQHNTHDIDVHDNTFFGKSSTWRALYYRNYETTTGQLANGNKFRKNVVSMPNYRNVFGPSVLLEYSTESTASTVFPALDSNKYFTLRPLDSLFATTYGGTFGYKTFSQWKTFTGGDANSTAVQKTAHNLFNNPSGEAIAPEWNSWKDAAGTALTGLLQPYSSIVGFNQGAQAQTISFASLPLKTYGDATFTLSATASSGLPVSYTSSNTSVATVSGNTVTILSAGATNITASQAGDGSYLAAPNVVQTLTVLKSSQVISFSPLPGKSLGDASFSLAATASSGLMVTYVSSNPSVATISGSTVTIVGAGTTTITASQLGNNNYNAAPNVGQALDVSPATDPTKGLIIITPDGKRWRYNGRIWITN